MNLWVGHYGLSVNHESMVFKSDSKEKVEKEVYDLAWQEYESYAGLHGILSLEEIAEEEGVDIDSDEAEELYRDHVENEIEYWVEAYDESNEEHRSILEAQEGEAWEV